MTQIEKAIERIDENLVYLKKKLEEEKIRNDSIGELMRFAQVSISETYIGILKEEAREI